MGLNLLFSYKGTSRLNGGSFSDFFDTSNDFMSQVNTVNLLCISSYLRSKGW